MATSRSVPVALSIAGSDCSSGAGIQADLKTFRAFEVYGLTAITCVVAETPGKVTAIESLTPGIVRAQIEVLLANFPVKAVKTGLLHTAEIVHEIADILRAFAAEQGRALPLIIDPVMVATSGDPLITREAVAAYEQELFPLASLVTPNLDEASALLDCPIRDLSMMHAAGAELHAKFGVPFLIKGGHLGGNRAIDLLFTGGETRPFEAPFTRDIDTHGTGCTYSAAITAGLAAGDELEHAIARAKRFVTAAITGHFEWETNPGQRVHALNHSPVGVG